MTLDMSGQFDQALVLLGALDGETADEGVDRSAHSEREPLEIRKVDILRIKTEETNLELCQKARELEIKILLTVVLTNSSIATRETGVFKR